uniref:Gluconokinase n=1 Tax=Fagus sylvatica TaxID=28930 RepID=A0A2N9G317_FAGSY
MDCSPEGIAVVIMGVSGAGKSTVGEMLAKVMNCSFLDADDYHPLSNKEKMRKGIPLSDEDRIPWLETLRDALRESLVNGKIVILGCSALQKRYRNILRSADPNYEPGSYASEVKFVLLDAQAEVLAARLENRAAEGKHFMPAKLLQSQIDLLQTDDSEGIFKVDATLSPQNILSLSQPWSILNEAKEAKRFNGHMATISTIASPSGRAAMEAEVAGARRSEGVCFGIGSG